MTKRINPDSLTVHTKKGRVFYNMKSEDIKPITATEIKENFSDNAKTGKPLSLFGKTIKNLEVGNGFSMPCEWPHNTEIGTRVGCPGTRKSHSTGRSFSYHVRTRCVDGTFYVLRLD